MALLTFHPRLAGIMRATRASLFADPVVVSVSVFNERRERLARVGAACLVQLEHEMERILEQKQQ